MHVLVRNNLVVKTIHSTRALTTAESANSGARRKVLPGVDIYIGGTVTLTAGEVSACTNPDALTTVQERRQRVKKWLAEAENLPVANWGLIDSDRATNYWRWLEIIGRGSATDSNLSNATEWGEIEAEMEIGAAKWYRDHNATHWKNTVTGIGTWYGTNTSNWRAKLSAGSMSMAATWTGGLVEYLHG